VPGPPIGLLLAGQRRDKGLVGRLPGRERGALVDGRTDQWMPKYHLGAHDLDQAGTLGRLQRLRGRRL
jgi:hypothetical protein